MATTKTYSLNVDGNAGQSVAALRREIKGLDADLANLTAGTAEYDAALRKLAARKDDLGDLKQRIEALNPDAKIKGFLALGNAIAGAFTVATVAAQQFGLSGDSLEKYQQKVIGLLGVLQGLEALRNALEPQNFAGLKSLASGFDLAAIRARFFGTTARAAIASTGIGLLVVGLGLLVANWDKVTAATDRFYQRFKPQFAAVAGLIETTGAKLRDFLSIVTFGLVDDAKTAAAAVAVEQAKIAAAALKAQDDLLAKQRDQRQKDIDKELTDEQRRRVALAKIRGAGEIDLARVALEGAKEREASAKFEVDGTKERELQYLEATAARVEAEQALTKAIQAEYDKRAKAEFDAFLQRNPADIKPLTLAEAKALAGIPDQLEEIPLDVPIKPRYQLEDENFAAFKQAVSDAVALAGQIGQAFAAEATTALDGQISNLDAQISALQERQAVLDAQLSETRSNIESAEKDLAESTGARRKFLIDSLDQQRGAEARLAKEKDRAAKEQAAAERQKQKLQERATQLSQAQIAAEALLATITLIRAANDGALKDPNPYTKAFTLAAIAVSGITAAFAVRNALKFADGGYIDWGAGPRADDVPILASRGEFVVNAVATARHRSELEAWNNEGRLSYIPRPTATSSPRAYADGGFVEPAGTATVDTSTAQIVGAITALRSDVRAIKLQIGEYEAELIGQQQAKVSTISALTEF